MKVGIITGSGGHTWPDLHGAHADTRPHWLVRNPQPILTGPGELDADIPVPPSITSAYGRAPNFATSPILRIAL